MLGVWSVTVPAGVSQGESACARRTTSLSFRYRPTHARTQPNGELAGTTCVANKLQQSLSGTTMRPSSQPARRLGISSSATRSALILSPAAPGHGSIIRAAGISAVAFQHALDRGGDRLQWRPADGAGRGSRCQCPLGSDRTGDRMTIDDRTAQRPALSGMVTKVANLRRGQPPPAGVSARPAA